jgi:hypothetical protein
MMQDESAEFVLIDGDLVSVHPQHTDQQHQQLDWNQQRELLRQQNYRSGRMRKGVKGLKKWIHKKKLGRRGSSCQQPQDSKTRRLVVV